MVHEKGGHKRRMRRTDMRPKQVSNQDTPNNKKGKEGGVAKATAW